MNFAGRGSTSVGPGSSIPRRCFRTIAALAGRPAGLNASAASPRPSTEGGQVHSRFSGGAVTESSAGIFGNGAHPAPMQLVGDMHRRAQDRLRAAASARAHGSVGGKGRVSGGSTARPYSSPTCCTASAMIESRAPMASTLPSKASPHKNFQELAELDAVGGDAEQDQVRQIGGEHGLQLARTAAFAGNEAWCAAHLLSANFRGLPQPSICHTCLTARPAGGGTAERLPPAAQALWPASPHTSAEAPGCTFALRQGTDGVVSRPAGFHLQPRAEPGVLDGMRAVSNPRTDAAEHGSDRAFVDGNRLRCWASYRQRDLIPLY